MWLSELNPRRASAVASHQRESIEGSKSVEGFATLTPGGVECRNISALTLSDEDSHDVPNARSRVECSILTVLNTDLTNYAGIAKQRDAPNRLP